MMQHSVSHAGFVDMPQFRIGYVKVTIWSVFISSSSKFLVQLKKIVFQIKLKFLDVWFLGLALFELAPSQKQIFEANNFLKNIMTIKPPPQRC